MRRRWIALSRRVAVLAVSLLGGGIGVERAHAAGVEDTVGGGTVALGRTAGYVRADDFMAVWQNPGNLALLPTRDAGLELRLPFFTGCFDRTPNPANTYLATESFDKSCNSGSIMGAGSLGFAMPLPHNFGFGFGIFTPGGTPNLKFGNTDINTININPASETLPGTSGVRESPGRYLLVDKQAGAAYLMAAVGYAPMPQLRFGLSAGAGVVTAKFKNVSSVNGGTFNDIAVVTDVKAADMFVPRAIASVGATPIDSIDLLATFTYSGDVSAKGDLIVTGNGIKNPQLGDCSAASPGTRCKVEDVTLEVPYQRFEVLLGGRYAKRRNKRERVLDPMKDEVFDIELNAYWSQTSHVDNYTLHIREQTEQQRIAVSSSPTANLAPLPADATLFHGWKDTYGVRLGGDYNVLPQLLAVRAGLGFETRGVPTANMNIDYWPVQKVTASLGATVKFGRWKVHASYTHVFNETVDVKVGEGNVKEVVSLNSAAAQVVNEGKYTSHIDVFSLQGNVSF